MNLQHSEDLTPGEQRYDAETLRNVTALAQQLQQRQQETLTAHQIEAIGEEVGVERAFIRKALAQLTPRSEPAKHPQRAAGTAGAQALARAWWAAAWTLLPISMSIGMLTHNPTISFILLFASLGAYIGVGYFLSSTAGAADAAEAERAPVSRSALLQSLFTLQRELESQKEHRAFLSVDVAGSSEMKRSSPELAVEYSFGQFRDWVESVVRSCGGEVQSAAGDGVMCMFRTDAGAVRAARQLQEGLAAFDREHNRLPLPFRIRCGISAGRVAVEPGTTLDRLQSAVIDRAANLQKQATPGDIVVDGPVAAAALQELGSLSALPVESGEPAFSWRGGQSAPRPLAQP